MDLIKTISRLPIIFSFENNTEETVVLAGAGDACTSPSGTLNVPLRLKDRRASWDETLATLSRDLKAICVSPTGSAGNSSTSTPGRCSPLMSPRVPIYVRVSDPKSPGHSPRTSPTAPTNKPPVSIKDSTQFNKSPLNSPCMSPTKHPLLPRCISTPAGTVQVSHDQSETNLADKLSTICQSPRSELMRSNRSNSANSQLMRRPQVPTTRQDFTSTVKIGICTIEDLHVFVNNGTLNVCLKQVSSGTENNQVLEVTADHGDLPATIALPAHCKPDKLICVVKAGQLLIRESSPRQNVRSLKSYTPPTLRRTASNGLPKANTRSHQAEQSPIVIEADGSNHLKIVINVSASLTMPDIKIKTVDNHLIVSGTSSHISAETNTQEKPNTELFQTFELPESLDPYNIDAKLTDKGQLVIHAPLIKTTDISTRF